jgi:putative DNA primase/helicase
VRHISGQWSGAILCQVSDVSGEFTGVWRIYVTEEGRKAFGSESKLGLGPTAGGAVRLFPAAHGEVALAEGVETALSVHMLSGLPVWATLSTSGMIGFEAPFGVDLVRIFPDYDDPRRARGTMNWRPSPGVLAAESLRDRLSDEGVRCVIDRSRPRRGRDYNDVLQAVGAVA